MSSLDDVHQLEAESYRKRRAELLRRDTDWVQQKIDEINIKVEIARDQVARLSAERLHWVSDAIPGLVSHRTSTDAIQLLDRGPKTERCKGSSTTSTADSTRGITTLSRYSPTLSRAPCLETITQRMNDRPSIPPNNAPPPLTALKGVSESTINAILAESPNDPTLRGGVSLWRPKEYVVGDTSEHTGVWRTADQPDRAPRFSLCASEKAI